MQQPPKVAESKNGASAEKRAWMHSQYIKTLREQMEDLDKACAQIRRTIYVLRKELGQ